MTVSLWALIMIAVTLYWLSQLAHRIRRQLTHQPMYGQLG